MFSLLVEKYPTLDYRCPTMGDAMLEANDLAIRLSSQHDNSNVYVYNPSSRLVYWTDGINNKKGGWWE